MHFFDFFRKFSLRRALHVLDDLRESENSAFPSNVHALYIEPPDHDDDLSGEDDAEEDSGGIPDNVCAGQLKASCELVFEDGHRINSVDDLNESNDTETTRIHDEQLLANILNSPNILADDQPPKQPSASTEAPLFPKRLCRVKSNMANVALPEANKNIKFVWKKDNSTSFVPIFPDASFEDCKGLKAHEQFEKFFDDDLLQYICDCSAVYATYRNRPNPKITVDGNDQILHAFDSFASHILFFLLQSCALSLRF